jgi:hypothetical protein
MLPSRPGAAMPGQGVFVRDGESMLWRPVGRVRTVPRDRATA